MRMSKNNYSISQVHKVLLSLLKKSLLNIGFEGIDKLSNELWGKVYRESFVHNVHSLIFNSVKSLENTIQLDNDQYKILKYTTIKSLLHNDLIISEQTNLLLSFEMADIESIILKGTSISCFYPKPELRLLGDIDILIRKKDADRAHEILLSNSYLYYGEHDFHKIYTKNNVMIELHFEVSRFPPNIVGTILKRELNKIFNNIVNFQINQIEFPSVTPYYNAIIQLLHMQRHLSKGIGLRQLCDWVMFVNANSQSELWESLLTFLSEIGLKIFAITLTKIGVKYLGLSKEKFSWCNEASDKVCDMLMDEILKSGNMGAKKDNEDSASGFLIGGFENNNNSKYGITYQYRVIFNNFNGSALRDFPILKKLPFLLPIMWVFIPIRYVVRMIYGKRPEISTRKLIGNIYTKKELYLNLKIFQSPKNK